MGVARSLGLVLASLLGVAAGTAHAQDAPGSGLAPGRYLGLSLGTDRFGAACDQSTQLLCTREDRAARLTAGTDLGKHWGAEFSWVDMGRVPRLGGDVHAQGLNLSVVGRTRLGSSVGVFGRLGTTYGRTDTSVMGAAPAGGAETGFGLAWGGGVSYDITPRLSATLEMDSQGFRFPGGTRDPVRSTSLGLRLRY